MPEPDPAPTSSDDGKNSVNAGTPAASSPVPAERTFTQAEFESALKDRLARQKAQLDGEVARARQAAEDAALAEQGKHKERADQLAARVADLEAASAASARDALVARLAHKHGLPDALWSRVQGGDEAALEADILSLVALLPAPAPPAPTGGAPTNPGKGGSAALTMAKINAMTPEEYAARREEIFAFLSTNAAH